MIRKVAAFVVDRGSNGSGGKRRRLLVFDDPMTGFQLPAGTVEPGERIEEAARREVREETGVHVRTAAQLLGSETVNLPREKARIVETTRTESIDTGEAIKFERGHRVALLERGPDAWRVRESVYDYTREPKQLVESIEGWVPLNAVTLRLERTFFGFAYNQQTALESKSHRADGHNVQVQWVSLADGLELFGQQSRWFEQFARSFIE